MKSSSQDNLWNWTLDKVCFIYIILKYLTLVFACLLHLSLLPYIKTVLTVVVHSFFSFCPLFKIWKHPIRMIFNVTNFSFSYVDLLRTINFCTMLLLSEKGKDRYFDWKIWKDKILSNLLLNYRNNWSTIVS